MMQKCKECVNFHTLFFFFLFDGSPKPEPSFVVIFLFFSQHPVSEGQMTSWRPPTKRIWIVVAEMLISRRWLVWTGQAAFLLWDMFREIIGPHCWYVTWGQMSVWMTIREQTLLCSSILFAFFRVYNAAIWFILTNTFKPFHILPVNRSSWFCLDEILS